MSISHPRPAIRPPLPLDHRRRAALPLVLQNRRRGRGLSRSAIAEITGLTPQSVTAIETGTQLPTLEVLFALADVLGTDAAELLHETRVLAESTFPDRTNSRRNRTWSTTLTPFFTRTRAGRNH